MMELKHSYEMIHDVVFPQDTRLYQNLKKVFDTPEHEHVWKAIQQPLLREIVIGLQYGPNTPQNKTNCRPQRQDLNLGFTWDKTPEGHAFWYNVHRQYQNIKSENDDFHEDDEE